MMWDEPTLVVCSAKRCAVADDGLFVSWTPRASSHCAEGQWCHWVVLARLILAHDNTPESDRVPWDHGDTYDECHPLCSGCHSDDAELWIDEHQPDLDVEGEWFSGGMLGPGWWVLNHGSGVRDQSWKWWVAFAHDVLAAPATAKFIPAAAPEDTDGR